MLLLTVSHHISSGFMSNLQSAYRKFYSSETALLYVQNDILASLDAGLYNALLLLDLSVAFDIVDYSIIVSYIVYNTGFVFHLLALINLFSSFLSDGTDRNEENKLIRFILNCSFHIKISTCFIRI